MKIIWIDKNTGCLKKIKILGYEIRFLGWGVEIGDGIGFLPKREKVVGV